MGCVKIWTRFSLENIIENELDDIEMKLGYTSVPTGMQWMRKADDWVLEDGLIGPPPQKEPTLDLDLT